MSKKQDGEKNTQRGLNQRSHRVLEEIVEDWILDTKGVVALTSIMELRVWSAKRSKIPYGEKIGSKPKGE